VTALLRVSATRAAAAAESVRGLFGRRLFAVPGTHLPHVAVPSHGRGEPWHYWWLAHYLDCVIDECERERRDGRIARAEYAGTLGVRLLRGIRLRNGLRLHNRYYDDMAWLLLAAQRLAGLDPPVSKPGHRLAAHAVVELAQGIDAGESDHHGGGLFWNDRRDQKNVATTGPAAIYYARAGDDDRARRLAEWIYATLHDSGSGLIQDGLHIDADGRASLDPAVYTYNQGAVLGALVALGDPVSMTRAAQLVAAIDAHLAAPGAARRLTTHGGHDGGLFTGIAARYLALAAGSPALADDARARAAALVRDTAGALWDGRTDVTGARTGRGLRRVMPGMPVHSLAFSPDPAVPADPGAVDAVLELSTQVQAWTVLEAAASLDALGDGPARPARNDARD
jgi:predicted alpha-1,6-mannanase (GH76 family)